MKRLMMLSYGVVCYAIFFATILYAIGFVGNIGVPKSIDAAPGVPLALALAINLGLLTLFAVQHSLMARPFFKRWWTKTVPEAAERSTYVLFSSLALAALFYFWEPLGGMVWEITNESAIVAIYTVFFMGWGLVFLSTFLIDHFDLFGLRQVWLYFRGREYTDVVFVEPWLYRVVRHPLYLGLVIAFWATPVMTVTHLFFAIATTAYVLVGIQLEERDLEDQHPDYKAYKEEVPMLIPSVRGPAPKDRVTA